MVWGGDRQTGGGTVLPPLYGFKLQCNLGGFHVQEMFIVKHDIIRDIYTFLAIFYIFVYLQLVYTFFKI